MKKLATTLKCSLLLVVAVGLGCGSKAEDKVSAETCGQVVNTLSLLLAGTSEDGDIHRALNGCESLSAALAQCIGRARQPRDLVSCPGIERVTFAIVAAKKSKTKEARDTVKKIHEGAKAYYDSKSSNTSTAECDEYHALRATLVKCDKVPTQVRSTLPMLVGEDLCKEASRSLEVTVGAFGCDE